MPEARSMPNPTSSPSALKVARTPTGHCVRVEGRGTMRESRTAAEFAARSLGAPGATVVVDLSACDYLDSTFLGCLVEVHKRAGQAKPPRFVISAPPETVKKLLGPTKLDLVLKATAQPPEVVGEYVTLPGTDPSSPDVMRHVMECHRRLAELGGPQQAAFAAIADSIERELREKA
jgi:anti-anti-sigma regulatory factor